MALHTAMINGVQVPGSRYVIYGTKRGYVSTHRTKRAALRALAKDALKCMRAGQPSDAQVYQWRAGWQLVGQSMGGADLDQVDDEEEAGGTRHGLGRPPGPGGP